MDGVGEFLEDLKQRGYTQGNLLGLFHILIGRRITKADGTPVSAGLTWRELAALLKRVRWDKDAVREVGLEPASLPPRDRERYWYAAIAHARVDSPESRQAGDRVAALARSAGYVVGPAPQQE
jgi:hypothetical protein